jgi:predicted transcriptional regulator
VTKALHTSLTRRERQIMDILFRRGRATAGEVMKDLPASTTSSTVRTQLRVLERKGWAQHEDDGIRFVYMPTVARTAARRSALRHMVDTFFDGSAGQAVLALLGGEGRQLSDEELARVAEMIERARREAPRKGGGR